MHSFQHSRARILFEVTCAVGMSASFVGAWMQTYAPAFLPAAAIAALYGVVHAFDMVRRRPAVDDSVAAADSVAERGETRLDASTPEPVAAGLPEFVETPVAEVAAAPAKRSRKPRKQAAVEAPKMAVAAKLEAEPAVVEFVYHPEPDVRDPEPGLHVVDSANDETEYVPATPLFEPEPFGRQQRAGFGRKAR